MSSQQKTVVVSLAAIIAAIALFAGVTGIGLSPTSNPTANATVMDAAPIFTTDNSGNKFELTVRFVDEAGQPRTANLVVSRPELDRFKVGTLIGTEMKVEYDADDPTNVRPAKNLFPRWSLFVIAFGAIAVAGVALAGFDLLRVTRFAQRHLNAASR